MRGAFRLGIFEMSLLITSAVGSGLPGSAAHAQMQARQFDIPAQPLASALLEFSRQSDVLIVFSPDITDGKHSSTLRASLPINSAIAELLRGTHLQAIPNPKGGYIVERTGRGRSLVAARPRQKNSAQSARLADNISKLSRIGSDEIVVTAQKRLELLRDTPVPVTVLNTSNLIERDQSRLQDYFLQVPGLSLSAQGNGMAVIILRGIATGNFGNPTVAVSIDDVPYGSSTALGGGQLLQPDLDPADLERIEVLRGPQGTLYGASSLGGLIKYVTTDPSTGAFVGRIQGGVNATEDGGIGYALRGSLNVPLSDTLALRVSGLSRTTPGYVDNVASGKLDVNALNVIGGRLAMLWKPSSGLSVKLSALHQFSNARGGSTVLTDYRQRPLVGDLNQASLPDSGAFRARTTLLTANVDLSLGWADLKSVTGYGRNSYNEASDTSPLFAAAPYNLVYSKLANTMMTHKFTQEVRLSSPTRQTFEWLVGGFYTHEHSPVVQQINGVDPATGKTVVTALNASFPTTYDEIAMFGDTTYHVTPAFNIQAGIRYSQNWQDYHEIDTGPQGETAAGVPFTTSAGSKDHAFTMLVVPQYKISDNLMAYLRFATGYRPGGPNALAVMFGLPATFHADKTLNYEAGMKGNGLHGRFTYDLSAYYIDWRSIQLRLVDAATQFSYFTNGGKARSTGVEGAFTYRPGQGLHLSASASYGEAEFTQTPPASVHAAKGDRLPFSPHFSGSASTDQDVAIDARWTGFMGGTVSYTGWRPSGFPGRAGSLRVALPSYTSVDLRVGARTAAWTLGLSLRNLGNVRGVLYSASQTARALTTSNYNTNFIQPRTVSFSIARSL